MYGPLAKRKIPAASSPPQGDDRSHPDSANWPQSSGTSQTRMRVPEGAVPLADSGVIALAGHDAEVVSLAERQRRALYVDYPSANPNPEIAVSKIPSARPWGSWIPEFRTLPPPAVPAAQVLVNELVGAAFLSAVAGFVDTAGFISLFGMFTAHITGGLVAGTSMINGQVTDGLGARVIMVPIFMFSVASATMVARSVRRRGRARHSLALMVLMTAALALFCAAGVLLHPYIHGPGNWAVGVVGGAGVSAMAIQNLLMRDALRGWSATTIMTGNLTQVTIHLVDIAFSSAEADLQKRARMKKEATRHLIKFGLPLIGFVFGACLSAWLTHLVGFWSIAVPTSAVGLATVWQWRQSRARAPIGEVWMPRP